MSVLTNTFWSQLDLARGNDPLSVHDTHWGFIVLDRTSKHNNGAVAEATLKILSIALLFGSIIPWITVGGELSAVLPLVKIAHTASFFAVGLAVYWYAGRGFRQEIHVDGLRQEIRLTTRNSRNKSTIRHQIPMAAVESCFLKRSKTSVSTTKMLLRLKGRQLPLMIASGNERDLLPILEQLVELVRSPQRTVEN